MTHGSTEQMIEDLTGDLRPVRRLRPPVVGAAIWLAVALALAFGIAFHHGLRPDIWLLMVEPSYAMQFVACLGTGILGAVAAFLVSLPDRSPRWALLPLPTLVLWFAGTTVGCYADWVQAGPGGIVFGTSFECMGWIVAVSLPIDALLVFMIRHAALVRPRLALVVGVVAAAALASAALMLFHPIEATLMIFVWHTGAVALMAGLAALGAPLFRRAVRI